MRGEVGWHQFTSMGLVSGQRMANGHILHDNEVYSQCLSQMSQTQRIIDQPAAPGADLHFAPGGESTPFPGDASKFLSAPCFYQCKALLPRAQPCEKIFCNRYDFQVHCRSVHRISGFKFCKVLDTDGHNNLWLRIIWFSSYRALEKPNPFYLCKTRLRKLKIQIHQLMLQL